MLSTGFKAVFYSLFHWPKIYLNISMKSYITLASILQIGNII